MIGKDEKKDVPSLHVSSLSIAPTHRKCGIATFLMHLLEQGDMKGAFFVDLFVRCSNFKAVIFFYEKNGYVKYRRVIGYYNNPAEDAFDMKMSFSRDEDKKFMVPVGKPIHAEMLDYES